MVLLLCFKICSSTGGTTDIICDPISRSAVQINFRENAAEDVDEDACPIVGVYISLKIALGKKDYHPPVQSRPDESGTG